MLPKTLGVILIGMDPTRKAIRGILLEQKMDQGFIVAKANAENLYPSSVEQEGLRVMVQLSSQGDDNAIRRFKNQLRIRNPRLERIEVRQPETQPKAEEKRPQQVHYTDWREKILQQLKGTGTRFGWNFYSDPTAGENTEYFLFIRGEGPTREVVRVRVSEHPATREKSDISIDMPGHEGTIADIRDRLKRGASKKDAYPLI